MRRETMSLAILDDAHLRPDLFVWSGQIDHERLVAWVQQHGWSIPGDLFELWVKTGGGDFFESETPGAPLIAIFDEWEGLDFYSRNL